MDGEICITKDTGKPLSIFPKHPTFHPLPKSRFVHCFFPPSHTSFIRPRGGRGEGRGANPRLRVTGPSERGQLPTGIMHSIGCSRTSTLLRLQSTFSLTPWTFLPDGPQNTSRLYHRTSKTSRISFSYAQAHTKPTVNHPKQLSFYFNIPILRFPCLRHSNVSKPPKGKIEHASFFISHALRIEISKRPSGGDRRHQHRNKASPPIHSRVFDGHVAPRNRR